MLVDTHVHLSHDRYTNDIGAVVERALGVGVEKMFIPAIDVASIERAIELCDMFEGLFAMTGVHPSHVKEATDEDFERVRDYAQHDSVVAIGESGLDYYWDRSFDEKQHDFLRRHIRLAISSDLPLILHSRESSEDLVRIIADERSKSSTPARLRGVFHCFSGPAEIGLEAIDLGFHLGIGGNVTYKNSPTRDALEVMPLERLLLETDGPFLAPVPHRGKRNEPAFVPIVAEAVAEAMGIDVQTVESVTTSNALSLFGVSAS